MWKCRVWEQNCENDKIKCQKQYCIITIYQYENKEWTKYYKNLSHYKNLAVKQAK